MKKEYSILITSWIISFLYLFYIIAHSQTPSWGVGKKSDYIFVAARQPLAGSVLSPPKDRQQQLTASPLTLLKHFCFTIFITLILSPFFPSLPTRSYHSCCHIISFFSLCCC